MPEDALASILLGLNVPRADPRVNDLSRRPVLQSIGGALVAGFSSAAHAATILPVTLPGETRNEDALASVTIYEELQLKQGVEELDKAVIKVPAAEAGVALYRDVLIEVASTKCDAVDTKRVLRRVDKRLDFKKFADDKFWADKLKSLKIDKKTSKKVVAATEKIKKAAASEDMEQVVVQTLALGEEIEKWAYSQK
jgi:hypothetical protein